MVEKQKAKDLRDITVEELEAQYRDARKELYHLRNKKRMEGKMDKPHQIWVLRKNIARYMTVIKQKQAQEAK